MIHLDVTTDAHTAFVDITADIRRLVDQQGWSAGRLTAFVPHTTAGITIQENADPDVLHDLELCLDRIVPWKDSSYRHFEGNTAAHVKASLLGSSALLILDAGRLQLGRWQGVYFCEFDGPRTREVWVEFAGA